MSNFSIILRCSSSKLNFLVDTDLFDLLSCISTLVSTNLDKYQLPPTMKQHIGSPARRNMEIFDRFEAFINFTAVTFDRRIGSREQNYQESSII